MIQRILERVNVTKEVHQLGLDILEYPGYLGNQVSKFSAGVSVVLRSNCKLYGVLPVGRYIPKKRICRQSNRTESDWPQHRSCSGKKGSHRRYPLDERF